ncbi:MULTISPECIES: ABC transporter ATP-binding protein [Bacillus]|uniref:ABC transporter ATP-binding protein n=1 Tax=Bacillus TaxID=1386 RepID=UPI000BB73A5A|nr:MULTISPECIES: ABC transporter ATP-binding protein [Bacillus]
MEKVLDLHIECAGYSDDLLVIHDINLEVKKGEMIGLLGPNGSGKSTTIKTLLGMNPFYKGNVSLPNGQSFAYLPEKPVFYFEMTLYEHIELMATLLNLEESYWRKRTESLLQLFEIDHVLHDSPSTFSKGMQQKAMISLAFMKEVDLYVIDEPFIGLDPNATKKLLNLLEYEKRRGAGILLSTHVLDTAERICDSFVLLSDGRIKAKGALLDIQTQCNLEGASLLDCFYKLSSKEVERS